MQNDTHRKAGAPIGELAQELDELQAELFSYEHALGIMEYDAMTAMPPAGAALASRTQGVLSNAQHRALTSPRASALLEELGRRAGELDGRRAAIARVLGRLNREERSVPPELAGDLRAATAAAFPAWRAAKEADDFASFAPLLGRVFDLAREKALCIAPGADPYDTLLDQNERGFSQAALDPFFALLSSRLAPLARACALEPVPERALALRAARASADAQAALGLDLARLMGVDESRLTLGVTEHPWTTEYSGDDVRIAHHYREDDVLGGVATSMHENGHALYEQRVDPSYTGTCLHRASSGGMDEGQARLMENIVGHCRPFMEALLPLLREHVPGPFDDASPDELYRACNVVRPGPVRTSADELTYPLHIVVRYECERALVSGRMPVADLPGLWGSLMRERVGVEAPDDARGCLQDAHWATGYIGYYPGYALGNAYGAQLAACARRAYPGDTDAAFAKGDLTPLTGWLEERVWRAGSSTDPLPLMEAACGEPFDPECYIGYLERKYTELYGLA